MQQQQQQQQPQNTQQLQQWFRAVDTDGSGSISVMELQKALAMGNLNFSLQVCAQIIRIHDTTGQGSINFNDFCVLHRFLEDMNRSFQFYDKDRSGTLTPDEVHQALTYAGFRLDQPAFYEMIKAFDPQRTGALTYAPYIAMTLFLRSATNTFKAFDPQGSGRISLDFSQFIYAASNCR